MHGARSTEDMPRKVLKEVFGFDSFREGQEEVIQAVLSGKDTLGVMPTGGGKSLCYQIPALMLDSLTVIVSPLISLMKDQVDSLLQSQVEGAAALHSGLTPEERWEVERRVRNGEIKMLLVAPERLRSMEFVLSLRGAASGVGLFVVDEAHCISEWGHDFRPDYLFLPKAIRDLGSPPVLALTATATPQVRQDVLRALGMREPEVVVTGFNRPNLTYRVIPAKKKAEKLPLVLETARASGGSGIVYCFTRKECEELAAELRRAGLDAEHYHAGLGDGERSGVQERFMTDELSVVVATVAFGMGVDKPNVRFVIHAAAPPSLPNYLQESGRAGRDGAPATCVLVYRGEDLGRRKRLLGVSGGEDEAGEFFAALARAAGDDGHVSLPPGSLDGLGGVERDMAGVLLAGLEDAGLLRRGYDLWAELEVRRVEEEPGEMRPEMSAVHAAMPGGGDIGLPELARRAGVRPAVAQASVYRMMASGVAEAVPRGALVDVRLRRNHLDGPSRRDVSSRLKRRKGRAYDQLDEVRAYAELDSCRREHLLRRFGDQEEVAPCGGCDVCLGESRGGARTEIRTEARGEALAAPVVPDAVPGGSGAGGGPEPDPELFERLRRWRSEQSSRQKVPAYVVLHNSHIEEISALKPRTTHELGAIKGVGLRRAARYGEEILALVRGEEPEEPKEAGADAGGGGDPHSTGNEVRGYEVHLKRAGSLLSEGLGSEAVPELARALESGGEEARREVDALLSGGVRSGRDEERSGREATG
ncbi:RecQ family ATP-dependent DNA helicase [Rubrobacter aplysinae]|uniref:RecQ family ATP-dependent DNA helicase n=1 Tax=Rubrobacter aplysinae TaxID=909625 RepID=UPI00069F12BF|nr:ATP-dependent DNA helicase RecQ [Rubrobacter aplysinae]